MRLARNETRCGCGCQDIVSAFELTLPGERRVAINRPKQVDGLLRFIGGVQLSPDQQSQLDKMTDAQRGAIVDQVGLELLRAKSGMVYR